MIPDLPYNIVNQVPYTCFDGIKGSKLMLCHTKPEWENLLSLMMKRKSLIIDTETNGFEWYRNDRIVGMSFGWGLTHWYVPVRHSDSLTGGKQPAQLDMDELRPDIQKLFAREDLIAIFFNYKFDSLMFEADDIYIKSQIRDARLEWQFIDENAPGALKTISSGWRDFMGIWHPGLVDKEADAEKKAVSDWRTAEARARKAAYAADVLELAKLRASEIRFQGWKKPDIKKYIREHEVTNHPYVKHAKEDVHYGYFPILEMTKYAALDTFLTGCVHDHCMPQILENKNIAKLYLNELKFAKVLKNSEKHGMHINVPYLSQLEQEFNTRIAEKELEVFRLLHEGGGLDEGQEVNLASSDQLIPVLQKMGVEFTELTKGGKLKSDQKVLAKVAAKVPAVKILLELRKLKKLKDTFVDGLQEALVDGNVIHPSFLQAVKTGRMSCSNPNVQQIPARDKSIRRAFIFPQEMPDDDFFYLFHDYSQIEVRLTAHASLEPVLIEAFELKQDVHLKSSCLMFDVPYEDGVSIYADETHKRFKEIENYRKIGKIINFAIIYGVSAVGLTVQIPRPTKHKDSDDRTWLEACQSFIDNYFDKHRQIKRFVQRSNKFVQYNGWVENAFGRIRHLPHYNAVKRTKRAELKYMEGKAKRQGTNFIVQSLASDIFKMACVRVAELLEGTRSGLVSYVHDENHIYMHRSDVHLVPSVKFLMENFKARVALTADTSISTTSWAEKVGVDGYDFKKVCELAKVEWTEELDQKAQDTLAFIKSKYKVIVIP